MPPHLLGHRALAKTTQSIAGGLISGINAAAMAVLPSLLARWLPTWPQGRPRIRGAGPDAT